MWHMFRRSHSLKSCVQVPGPSITAFANPWSKAWNDSTIRMAPPPAPPPAADRCRWRRLLPLLLPLLLVLATGQASAAEVPGGQSSLTPGQTLEQVGTVAAGQGEIYPDIAPPAGTNPALVITLTPLVRCRPCHSTAHALPQHSTAHAQLVPAPAQAADAAAALLCHCRATAAATWTCIAQPAAECSRGLTMQTSNQVDGWVDLGSGWRTACRGGCLMPPCRCAGPRAVIWASAGCTRAAASRHMPAPAPTSAPPVCCCRGHWSESGRRVHPTHRGSR